MKDLTSTHFVPINNVFKKKLSQPLVYHVIGTSLNGYCSLTIFESLFMVNSQYAHFIFDIYIYIYIYVPIPVSLISLKSLVFP